MLVATGATASDLTGRIVASGQRVPDSVIVGRADCADVVWLLNEDHQLVGIDVKTRETTLRQLRGLRASDRPWGLACVAAGALWTLADPRALARIGFDGRMEERVTLQVPRIALFAAGDRLLFEPLPPVAGVAVLATSPPRRPLDVRLWPGLLARNAADPGRLLTDNLVNCGLAREDSIPCWFPDDTRVTISDGLGFERRSFPSLRGPDVAVTAPIRDVAFRTRQRVWLLATARERLRGRLVGGQLVLAVADGREIARLTLNPPARLILAATDRTCLLLTVDGDLQEISER